MKKNLAEKFNESEFKKLFKKLEKSIDYENKLPEIVEKTESVITKVVDKVENAVEQPVQIVPLEPAEIDSNVPLEPPVEDNGSSIFEDIKNETNEDKNIGTEITEIADNFNELDNQDFETAGTNEALKIKAQTQTELINVGFSILFCLITWEFTKENFDNWQLHKARKTALTKTIYQVLLIEKKKTNPKKELMWLILGSYAPLLIIAISTLFSKMKQRKIEAENKKKEIEANRLLRLNESKQVQENNFGKIIPATEQPIDVKKDIKIYENISKSKDKRGRHKNICASHKGKPCNCK